VTHQARLIGSMKRAWRYTWRLGSEVRDGFVVHRVERAGREREE